MKIVEPQWVEDFKNGMISGDNVQFSKKLYKDAKAFYSTIDESLDPNTIMYTVYSCERGEKSIGNLNWGLTVMEPIYINGECNVTRGHFHENLDCDEIYICAKGEGYLLLMDENGDCSAERMEKGSIHHIDGHYAHRLVNTGEGSLEVMCCWSSSAGHDYTRVEKMPFQARAYKVNGKIIWEEGEQ